jgi:hypothetical protein
MAREGIRNVGSRSSHTPLCFLSCKVSVSSLRRLSMAKLFHLTVFKDLTARIAE